MTVCVCPVYFCEVSSTLSVHRTIVSSSLYHFRIHVTYSLSISFYPPYHFWFSCANACKKQYTGELSRLFIDRKKEIKRKSHRFGSEKSNTMCAIDVAVVIVVFDSVVLVVYGTRHWDNHKAPTHWVDSGGELSFAWLPRLSADSVFSFRTFFYCYWRSNIFYLLTFSFWFPPLVDCPCTTTLADPTRLLLIFSPVYLLQVFFLFSTLCFLHG